jgi:hypothetical protein
VVSRIELCPNCGSPGEDALYIPIGPDNHIYACRHCDTVWGSVGEWATLEEYARHPAPDDDTPPPD